MEYEDMVYGRVQIDAPVLLDLMASDAMVRLQGVLQHGITGLIGITQPVTRFDHSVGVMLLVGKLGASLEEQIAALLHDVSHTAFSHVIDYVFDDHDGQSFHDEQKETYLIHTDVPAVLARHGYDWRVFLHEEDYPLLEQPAPRLCGDRLDYFLRDSQELGLSTSAEIDAALADLVVVQGRIGCATIEVARWLGDTFMQADDSSWANFREVGLYELTAQAIRRALDIGVLTMDDIWGTDQPAWQKLRASADGPLREWVSLISAETRFAWDEANPTFKVSTKLRAIDPDVAVDGRLVPLSQLDPAFGTKRETYLRDKAGKWPMRVIAPETHL